MKQIFNLTILILAFAFSINAQNDTMYIMKDGHIWAKFQVGKIDSVIFYHPNEEPSNSFIDPRDGKVYNTVTIGSQTWMAENLAYLPSINEQSANSDSLPYYYVYGFNGTNVNIAQTVGTYIIYGVLYNYSAAKNACPCGWHLPSDEEWTQLSTFLGGDDVSGGKLKATGYNNWVNPNTGATNETGFSGLPGGYRSSTDSFSGLLFYGYWWSSTVNVEENSPWVRWLSYNNATFGRGVYNGYKSYGFSVRCLKN